MPQPRMPRRAGEDDEYYGRGGPRERAVRWRIGRAARIIRHGAVSADTGPRRAGTAGRRILVAGAGVARGAHIPRTARLDRAALSRFLHRGAGADDHQEP